MSLLNESMTISGLDKNNLTFLKNNFSITNLEIKQLTLKDNWELLSELKQLRSLTVKDSYVDFKKFYSAICSLPKLERLIYNHYCFFNKNKKDKLPNNLKLSSLKIFKLEFPDESEPDFEINTYAQKSYKNKHNSITELKDCHKIFPNLEEIQFVNYQTYKKKIINEDEKKDIKKVNSEVYWNMDFKSLDKFKNLKNIVVDKGSLSDIYINGLEHFLKIIEKRKLHFFLNGQNKTSNIILDVRTVNFFCGNKDEKNNIFAKNEGKFLTYLKNHSIDLEENYYNINELNYYKDNYNSKPFSIKKNKSFENILNSNPTCFIFKSCFRFLNINNTSYDLINKIKVYQNIIKNQKNLKKIIFDLSRNEKYDGDGEWNSDQVSFLIKFIFEIKKIIPDIKIYLYHSQIEDLLNGKDRDDKFKIHLIYLFNAIKINDLKNNLEIIGASDDRLEKLTTTYIQENIDQVVIVDDIFYDISKYFPEETIIYHDQLNDIKRHYAKYYEEYYNDRWSKLNFPFKENYREILRIVGFYDNDFNPDPSSLIIIIKKRSIKRIKNLNLKKTYIYLGASLHHVTHHMNYTEKEWKAKKIVGILVNNNPEGIKKIKDKLYSVAEKTAENFLSSDEIDTNNISKKDLLKSTEDYKIVENLNINKDTIKNVTHCWIEGVNPWQEKYINLSKFNDLFPSKNLEYLKLSDCIHFENLNLPKFPRLKVLKLNFFQNHHKKSLDKVVLTNFENCPNLQKIEIRNLTSFYNKALFKFTLGYTGYGTNLHYNDTWTYINVDLSKINQLKKLEEIDISKVLASDLRNMKSIESLKKIHLNVFHFTKDDYLTKYDEQPEINDQDLSFFYGCTKLEELNLRLGDQPWKEDMSGEIYTSYKGNGDFLNKINHKLKKLSLNVNVGIKNQTVIQDIINKITNRFLFLEEVSLSFGIAARSEHYDSVRGSYNKKIDTQILDIAKFLKLKNLTKLIFQTGGDQCFIKFKTINSDKIVNLKKIKDLDIMWSSVSFAEFRKVRMAFKKENFDNPSYYDEEYNYYEDDDEYKKNWNRMSWINTDDFDWYSLESRYLKLEKEENEKKYKKPKQIIRKRKN